MSKTVTVALDAMGGDHAPDEIVKGTIDALRSDAGLSVKLTGDSDKINKILANEAVGEYKDRLTVIHTTEVIGMSEKPVTAIRAKKDSSMVVALGLVKKAEADAVISAGNSGALLVGGQTVVGRIRGIERPCLAPVVPTPKGPVIIVDGGANMDAKPAWLVQWAQMGSIYMESMFDVKKPSVALVNIGEEQDKGNKLTLEAYPLLQEAGDINFTGNVEARDVSAGDARVVVCDAFVGNVLLKMYEGVAKTLLSEIKSALMSGFKSKIGALLIKGSLKNVLQTYNAKSYGGAVLLGAKGPVIKAHGNSKRAQIKIALLQAALLIRKNISEDIKNKVAKKNSEEIIQDVDN